MTPSPDSDDVRALTDTAHDLAARVKAMDRDAAVRAAILARQARSNRRLIRLSWAMLGLLVLALAAGGLALSGVQDNTRRLDISSTVSRQKALCPLYQVLLDDDTPKARARATDKEAYDKAYVVIREGYSALDCEQFKGSAPKLG